MRLFGGETFRSGSYQFQLQIKGSRIFFEKTYFQDDISSNQHDLGFDGDSGTSLQDRPRKGNLGFHDSSLVGW